MEGARISGKGSAMRNVYVMRRLIIIVLIILVIVVLLLVKPFGGPSNDFNVSDGTTPIDITKPPVYEQPPVLPIRPVVDENESNETVVENCLKGPIEELGCLELNDGPDIFGAKGMNFDDKRVEKVIDKVEEDCGTGENGRPLDRDCILDTAVTKSENTWICEWKCMQALSSCPIYKMHLGVAVLRKYVPATDAFVGRTDDFQFFIVYKDNKGEWVQPQYTFNNNPKVEAIYNDVYHSGPMTEVVFPQVTEVKTGGRFCFKVTAPRSCVCSVKVLPFTVGDCEQVPADMKGICTLPVTEKYLKSGENEICFNVADNATRGFYTYKFELTGGDEWIPAGNAFIKERKWDCCVNVSFDGFLSVT